MNADDIFKKQSLPKFNFPQQNVPFGEDDESIYDLLENQIHSLKDISDSAKSMADSAKIQSDVALKTSKKADIKGWLSVIISVIALTFEFAVNHKAIIDFFLSLTLNN
jgi:hypothetical protein